MIDHSSEPFAAASGQSRGRARRPFHDFRHIKRISASPVMLMLSTSYYVFLTFAKVQRRIDVAIGSVPCLQYRAVVGTPSPLSPPSPPPPSSPPIFCVEQRSHAVAPWSLACRHRRAGVRLLFRSLH